MRVGFDLDGVLFDFGQSVREYMDSIGLDFGYEGEPPHWNFFEKWGMTGAEFVQLCNDGVDAGFIFRNNVRANAVSVLWEIRTQGHDIVVITDRHFGSDPEHSRQATIDWWGWAKFPWSNVEFHFSPDKTIAPTDCFIEDKVENFQHLWNNGTPCWLVDRPWNQHIDTQYRISDVSEYPAKIEELTKGLVFLY